MATGFGGAIVEEKTYRGYTIKLIQDSDGFWGWWVAAIERLPFTETKTLALLSAQKEVDKIIDFTSPMKNVTVSGTCKHGEIISRNITKDRAGRVVLVITVPAENGAGDLYELLNQYGSKEIPITMTLGEE